MDDKDELIKLILNANTYDRDECKLCSDEAASCECCYAESLAEQLLANDVIVKPICSECVFDDGLNWHQCELCIGDKSNKFVPLADFSNDFDQ